MTPRTEKPNRFKREAQERKAERLAAEIRALAAASKLPALEVFGRLDAKAWRMLCVCSGVNAKTIPSAETQALILGRLTAHRSAGGVS